jgi:hypothetical protein
MHGIAYDDVQDVIVVPAQLGQAVLSFRGDARGEEHPLRVIQGPHTEIQQADRVAVDSLHKEIFVGDAGQVLVFPANANGDAAPVRAIRGPDTQLGGRGGIPPIAVDPVNNVLVVASTSILIFDRTADGNAKPLRVITGSDAGGGRLAAATNGLIFAASRGALGVWSVNDNGSVAPRFRIGEGVLQEMRGVAIDAKNQDVIITDKELNAVLTYHVPEVFRQETSR